MTGAQAQAAYENALEARRKGAAPTSDLAAHIASCGPCSSALHALELQGDAVSQLASEPGSAGDGTAVESILRVAARSGTSKFADLAYELAKACLIQLPNLERRVRRVVEPREAPVVARELRTAHQRRDPKSTKLDMKGVPAVAPAEADALRAAASCLHILENVEGASPRQVLGMSQVHIFKKQPEKAEQALRSLLEQPLSPQMQQYARSNLMLAFIRQEKYSDAAAIGERALLNGPDEWMVLYNLAVAHAYLKNRRVFTDISGRLAKLVSLSPSSYLRDLLAFEVPRFAAELSIKPEEVAKCFGLVTARRSRRDAS